MSILCRKMIRPSSFTLSSLRHHKLCYFDYMIKPSYVPIVAFYSKPTKNINASQILETSLSKVLASYYPFAGRIVDHEYVDCNDRGAEYFNVGISRPMSEILNNPYNDATHEVFPQDLPWTSSLNRTPFVIQLSHFDCGGIAVSICISHKIVDGYSLGKFLNDWAATARQSDHKPSPRFDAYSFFPLMDDPPAAPKFSRETQQCVSRMFHFGSCSLRKLKDMVAMRSQVQNPSRVEVASAFLHKCGVEASSSGLFKPSLLSQVMNVRPAMAVNTIGNAVMPFFSVAMTEDEVQVPKFVTQLRKAKQDLQEIKDMGPEELVWHSLEVRKVSASMPVRDMFDVYTCSSFCNLGLNTIDFGWGRPVRVTRATSIMNNSFFFFDDPSRDGINALITLREAHMSAFQTHKHLQHFASPIL